MEIIVKGEAEMNFKPDQIEIYFDFKAKAKTYEEVLSKGISMVDNYLKVLENLGFDRKDVKTRSFRVSDDTIYNESTRKYDKIGFVYTQSANLKFDYSMEKLAKIMEDTATLDEPPTYRFNLTVKESKQAEEELLALAYKDAEFQANAIAKASAKKLVCCSKVSFQPFESGLTSETSYDGRAFAKMACCEERGSANVQNIFVPEDVVASMELYCSWIAE